MKEEYIGDIYMITFVDYKKLEYLKLQNNYNEDYLDACKIILAKENATLLKINHNCYIDLDSIKTEDNINKIVELIKNGGTSNLLMNNYVCNPYVGQLFVYNLTKKQNITLHKTNTQN